MSPVRQGSQECLGAGAWLPHEWLRSLRLRMLNSRFSTTAQIAVMAMPLWVIGSIQTGRRAKKVRAHHRHHAHADAYRHQQLVAAVGDVGLVEDLDAAGGDHAEHGDAGAAEYRRRDRATRKAALGSMLRRIRKPAAATVT